MKKIAVLYVAIGRYTTFWEGFVESCERHFAKGREKTYFVFTDRPEEIVRTVGKVVIVPQKNLGWPNNTLLRYHMFKREFGRFEGFDLVYYFNANSLFVADDENAFIPKGNELVVVRHPGFVSEPRTEWTYERDVRSCAHVPKGCGEHYVCGGFTGGRVTTYRKMVDSLVANIDTDRANGITAVWHDESHLNRYVMSVDHRVVGPEFAHPEEWPQQRGKRAKLILRDKRQFGGHSFIRSGAKKRKFGIDRFVCINLDRRLDRWVESKKEFDAAGLNVERVPALPHAALRPLPNGKRRCGLIETYKKIWQRFQGETVCIFEDDVTFSLEGTLWDRLGSNDLESQLPEDWGFVMLGGYIWGPAKKQQVSRNLIVIDKLTYQNNGNGDDTWFGGSHAVVYSPKAMEILASTPDSELYRNLFVDVLIQDLFVNRYCLPCFCLYPMIAYQREDYSDLEGGYSKRDYIRQQNESMIVKNFGEKK